MYLWLMYLFVFWHRVEGNPLIIKPDPKDNVESKESKVPLILIIVQTVGGVVVLLIALIWWIYKKQCGRGIFPLSSLDFKFESRGRLL
jgi:hypothetical protein